MNHTPSDIIVRAALAADAEVISDFNQRMALETEDHRLDPAVSLRGVRRG